MQSKFSTPVAMRCSTIEQADSLRESINPSGYSFARHWQPGDNWVTLSEDGYALWSCEYAGVPNDNGVLIESYNLPLFKALAAMREGDEFYPGEWVRLRLSNEYGIVNRNHSTNADAVEVNWLNKTYSDTFPSHSAWKSRITKLTVEEILAHFKEKEQPAEGLGSYPNDDLRPSLHGSIMRDEFKESGYTVNGEQQKEQSAEVWLEEAKKWDTGELGCMGIDAGDGSVTITSEALREIWDKCTTNLLHYLLDEVNGDLFRDEFTIRKDCINHLYSQVPFGAKPILDKHFKREEVFTSDMLKRNEVMEVIGEGGESFYVFRLLDQRFWLTSTKMNPIGIPSDAHIEGKKLPAGTPITFHSL